MIKTCLIKQQTLKKWHLSSYLLQLNPHLYLCTNTMIAPCKSYNTWHTHTQINHIALRNSLFSDAQSSVIKMITAVCGRDRGELQFRGPFLAGFQVHRPLNQRSIDTQRLLILLVPEIDHRLWFPLPWVPYNCEHFNRQHAQKLFASNHIIEKKCNLKILLFVSTV